MLYPVTGKYNCCKYNVDFISQHSHIFSISYFHDHRLTKYDHILLVIAV